MKLAGMRLAVVVGVGLGALPGARGDETPAPGESANPYRIIAERNAFGIKPQEPPPPPPPPVVPPAPPANIFLTGITDLGDGKQAYFSVNKPGAKGPEYVALKEGETQGEIQVVSIDPRTDTVRIKNAGNELALNFKDNGLKSAVGAPGVPPPPGAVAGVPGAVPQPGFQPPRSPGGAPGVSGPVVVGRRGEVQNSPTPTVNPVATSAAGEYGTPATSVPSASAPLRELPVRRTRADVIGGVSTDATGTPASSVPDGVKVVPPPNFRPPLPGQPAQ